MFRTFVILIAAAVLAGLPATSQTTFATITGLVTDSSGATVPNAKVSATSVETNITLSTVSNPSGNYTIPQLKEGAYTVRIQAPGFREFVAQNVVLGSRDLRRVDAQLEVGSVEATVEVTAGATLIETETARITDMKSADLMKTLPLNTRGVWAFLSLSPNVPAGRRWQQHHTLRRQPRKSIQLVARWH